MVCNSWCWSEWAPLVQAVNSSMTAGNLGALLGRDCWWTKPRITSYIYIYIYVYTYTSIYIYVYIYTCTHTINEAFPGVVVCEVMQGLYHETVESSYNRQVHLLSAAEECKVYRFWVGLRTPWNREAHVAGMKAHPPEFFSVEVLAVFGRTTSLVTGDASLLRRGSRSGVSCGDRIRK